MFLASSDKVIKFTYIFPAFEREVKLFCDVAEGAGRGRTVKSFTIFIYSYIFLYFSNISNYKLVTEWKDLFVK